MSTQHPEQWNSILSMHVRDRLPPALMLIGPQHCSLPLFVWQTIKLFFCKNVHQSLPCTDCSDCIMVDEKEHPDVVWIKPEKNSAVIKIDQIRDLQYSAFLTPQRAAYKIIVIDGVEKMNNAASNALLKTLEEPSLHVHFILLAEQISSVMPTILSRCQMLHFFSLEEKKDNLLQLGLLYPEQSERRLFIEQADLRINELISLIEKKQHPCILAAQWSQYELQNTLWFLSLLYSQISYLYNVDIPLHSIAYQSLYDLKALLHPTKVFEQLDKINNILSKLSHNMHVNHLLTLETLFFLLYAI